MLLAVKGKARPNALTNPYVVTAGKGAGLPVTDGGASCTIPWLLRNNWVHFSGSLQKVTACKDKTKKVLVQYKIDTS